MYRDPIRVDSNDPLLSATSLEGTVIGILFEKSGEEVKNAIKSRVAAIEAEILKNVEMITPIRDFLKGKDDLISEVEIYEQNRDVEKIVKLKPLTKKQEEANELLRKINEEIRVCGKEFDLETHEGLKEELKKFKTGWEKIDSQLEDLERIHEEEVWKVQTMLSQTADDSGETITTSHGATGTTGSIGVSGSTEVSGPCGYSGKSGYSGNSSSSYSPVHTPIDWQAARGEIEVEETRVAWKLRHKIDEYKSMFQVIKGKIESLEFEKRRLEMIARNISSDRKFKLSLVQLSAFGFEDIELN